MNVICLQWSRALQPYLRWSTILAFLSLTANMEFAAVNAQQPSERVVIAGSNDQWYVEGTERAADVRLAEFLGRPAIWLKNGTQVMQSGVEFVDGTIEFDFAPLDHGNFLGIIFRRVSFGNHENIYLRLHRSGLYNAIQYAPRMNFSPTWQLYPEFNAVADFPRKQWTHVRLEVRGSVIEMYLNDQPKPALAVKRLRGVTDKGAVSFWGRVADKPAEWAVAIANVSIRPANPSPPERAARPDPPTGTLTAWELSGPVKTVSGAVASLPEVKEWQTVEVEESGLVNINRALRRAPGRATAFARTTLKTSQARSATLEIGYSDDVTVFLNGERIYSGVNGFDSRHPEYMGFVKPEYENVSLRLRPGDNELVLAVTDDQRFGWGFIARLKERLVP